MHKLLLLVHKLLLLVHKLLLLVHKLLLLEHKLLLFVPTLMLHATEKSLIVFQLADNLTQTNKFSPASVILGSPRASSAQLSLRLALLSRSLFNFFLSIIELSCGVALASYDVRIFSNN